MFLEETEHQKLMKSVDLIFHLFSQHMLRGEGAFLRHIIYITVPFEMCFYHSASVHKNPLAKRTTLKTLQHVTTKWLQGARDRDRGHKRRMEAAAARHLPIPNDNNLDWLPSLLICTPLRSSRGVTYILWTSAFVCTSLAAWLEWSSERHFFEHTIKPEIFTRANFCELY